MGILRGLKNCVAFLTIFPVGMDRDGLSQAAAYMLFFPLIGGFTGLIAGLTVWILERLLPTVICGFLGLGALLLITGVHHTDGLLDFGDALVFHGSRDEKLRVLHDNLTGAGALSLGLVVITTTALSIGSLNSTVVVQSIVASEASAKFALVLLASVGRSASPGMNAEFVAAGHGKYRLTRLIVSAGFVLLLSVPTLGLLGMAVILSSMATGGIMLALSTRQFGGITGDVMGAVNDLTRMVSLLALVGMSKWF